MMLCAKTVIMETSDILDPARAIALHATLGLTCPAPGANDLLPAFWHYIYFWDAQPAELLGNDGHPKIGGFIPDLGLPRRMWAGGDLQFMAPLRLGLPAKKVSKLVKVDRKTGTSGPLAIVIIEHRITQEDRLCILEKQSLIYRKAAKLGAPTPIPPRAQTDETVSETHSFTTTQLFRYSALTFNGHRIHYDQEYAQKAEGYPDLIVHGPLLAQLLIQFAELQFGNLKAFSFQATAPLFVNEAATLCAKPNETGLDLWVRGPDGRLNMRAKAIPYAISR
jgi:3-methylfumaryl-CoA hydratase